jgi:hypothetical protein
MASLSRNGMFLTSHEGIITCFVAGDIVGSVPSGHERVLCFGGQVIELTEAEHALLTQPEVSEEPVAMATVEETSASEEITPVAPVVAKKRRRS